jgi:hypothetical protein
MGCVTLVLHAVVVSKNGPGSTALTAQVKAGCADAKVVVQIVSGPVPVCAMLAGQADVGT